MTELGWKYGKIATPITTLLEGHEPAVSAETRDRVFWLLRRYTSLFYIERQHFLLTQLIEALKGDASRAPDPFEVRWFSNVVGELSRYAGIYEKGIALLRKGEQRGYDSIAEGVKASEYLTSRVFYDEGGDYSWIALGRSKDRPLVGILAWGRRAYTMIRNTRFTLRAEWTYQQFREEDVAESDSVY